MSEPGATRTTTHADGDRRVDDLYRQVYSELRRRATALLRGERAGQSLDATALVHEAYLRLLDLGACPSDRAHFAAIAARAMRRVLIDRARRRKRQKRGGNHDRLGLETALLGLSEETSVVDAEAIEAALKRLAAIAPRAAELVQLRFFGGLSAEEAAAALGLSLSTTEREWRYARAWLRQRLAAAEQAPGDSEA